MKEVVQVMQEIKELESRLSRLKAELQKLQDTCEHDFAGDTLMITCSHCMKSESHYY